MKLAPTDPAAVEHEAYIRILDQAFTFDQINAGSSAAMESASRSLQGAEERIQERNLRSKKGNLDGVGIASEASIMSGATKRCGVVYLPSAP